MRTTNDEAPSVDERTIVMTRTFDAPRTLVFKAWTDPQHIGNWWGPQGFTVTTHAIDIRPGGVWSFTLHGPDGVDYPNWIVYEEITAPERLVYRHGETAADDPEQFHVTVTFAEQAGRTLLTMNMLFSTAAERERTVGFGAIELGQQTLGRLAEHLAQMR